MRSIRLFSLILCVLLLLPLCTSCAWERYDLLYEVEQNGITYSARGKGDHVKQIVVKEQGKIIWSKSVKTDRRMAKVDETYGLSIQDLDFDGYDDILIATKRSGECIAYDCYVRVGAKKQYNLWNEFEGLYNIKADERLGAIFAFEQTREARGDDAYATCNKATKYFWKEGKLVPDMYVALHYYSNSEQYPYCYAIAYYDEELGDFLDSSDKWLTEEEYEAADLSVLYYFK